MKKIIKNNLFGFILGILVSGSIVYATTLIDSKDVIYNANDDSFEVSNVESALNVLYDKIGNKKVKTATKQSLGGTNSTVSLELEQGDWLLMIWPFRIATYYEVYIGMDSSNVFSMTGGTYAVSSEPLAPIVYDVTITDTTGTVTFTKQLAGYKSTAAIMVAIEK